MKIIDVLKTIHEVGGCDATDEWSKGYDAGVNAAYSAVVDAFEKANEELKNKVVIPQCVADWIEEVRAIDRRFKLEYLCDTTAMPNKVYYWLSNQESTSDILARAWLDGYTIEPEKLYTLKLANGKSLCKHNDKLFFSNMTPVGSELTKAEIESVDPILMEIAKVVN